MFIPKSIFHGANCPPGDAVGAKLVPVGDGDDIGVGSKVELMSSVGIWTDVSTSNSGVACCLSFSLFILYSSNK